MRGVFCLVALGLLVEVLGAQAAYPGFEEGPVSKRSLVQEHEMRILEAQQKILKVCFCCGRFMLGILCDFSAKMSVAECMISLKIFGNPDFPRKFIKPRVK